MKNSKSLLPVLVAAATSLAPVATVFADASNLTWAGTSTSYTWDEGTSSNWTDESLASTTFTSGDNATFTSSVTHKIVTFTSGNTITAGTVEIASGDYTFVISDSGTATLGGSTLTVDSGATLGVGDGNGEVMSLSGFTSGISVAGTLIYNNSADSWSNLTLNGGTLYLSSDTGSSGLTITGTTTVSSESRINVEGNATLTTGTLAGSGELFIASNDGASAVTISSLGDYSGTIFLTKSSGSLTTTVNGSGTSKSASFDVNSGATLNFASASDGIYVANVADIMVNDSATVSVGTGNLYFEALTLKSGAKVELKTGDSTYGSVFGDSSSQIVLYAPGGSVTIAAGTSGDNTTVNGTISGTGTLNLEGYSTTDSNSWTVAAKITGSVAVAVGLNSSQQVTLSGTNTYTGGTTISSGILAAANASALGTGEVSIEGGQLSISSGIVLSVAGLIIVLDLNDTYVSTGSTCAVAGSGTLSLGDSGKITLSLDDDTASAIASAGTTGIAYNILSSDVASKSSSITVDSFTVDGETEYTLAYESGVLTISVAAVPEPSTFGLLAGLGARGSGGVRLFPFHCPFSSSPPPFFLDLTPLSNRSVLLRLSK